MGFRAAMAGVLAMAAASPALADWTNWRPEPPDARLEAIVRAAYTGAAAYARDNLNYFARDDETDGVRDAIAAELAGQGFAAVSVGIVDGLDAARRCAAGATELRFAVTVFGDGIDLAAASQKRVFSYHYDPHEDAAIVVAAASNC